MISENMYALGSRRSTIRELFEYGKREALRVGKENIFDFSLGNPSAPPPKEVEKEILRLLNEEGAGLHGYTSAQGDESVRRAIADGLHKRYGAFISPDRIYMTCGAAASLCIVLHALGLKGGKVAVQAPYFPEYKVFVEGAGGCLTAVTPKEEDFDLNLDGFEKTLTPDTYAVLINSPNNPTGVVYSEARLRSLAELLREKASAYGHPIYLISDEPYRELTYGKKVPYLPALYPDTVICYSYSKSLSLPGERIGYIAVPDGVSQGDRLYAALLGAGRALGYVCAPSLFQRVVKACGELPPDLDGYRRNRDTLYAALTAMGYSCVVPDGAFYLFVKAPGGDARAFSERAKDYHLLVVPSDDFGCPGYLRLSYCVPYERIKRSLVAFGQVKESFS